MSRADLLLFVIAGHVNWTVAAAESVSSLVLKIMNDCSHAHAV